MINYGIAIQAIEKITENEVYIVITRNTLTTLITLTALVTLTLITLTSYRENNWKWSIYSYIVISIYTYIC